MKKRPSTKNAGYNWLVHPIRDPIKNRWVVFRKKFWIFLKQTQPNTIINQHMLTYIEVENNQQNQNHTDKKEKKQSKDKIIKDAKNIFRVLKENKAIKDKIIKYIRTLFEWEKTKKKIITNQSVRILLVPFISNMKVMVIELIKTLPIKKHFDKIKPYWKDINNLNKSDTWKTQLTM